MNEEWIKEMQQKMAGYEHPAPELPWDEVDRVLSANKSRSARQLWLKRLAAAAVLLLIAGVGYWSLLDHETEPMRPTTVLVKDQSPRAYSEQPEKQADMAPVTSDVILKKAKPQHALVAMSESEEVTPVSTAGADTISSSAPAEQEQPQVVERKEKPSESPRHIIYPSDLREHKHSENRLTAQVYMSSTMVDSRQTESFYIPYVIPIPSDELVTDNPNEELNSVTITHIQKDRHIHHRQPIRFGLSLRYRLNDRWSMESGLSYTRLSSDIITTENGITSMTEQRLNYLGLPLNIIYNLWQSRHLGLYVSAGGVIEKSLDTSPWQFSLNGAAGAEYKLTDFFSLYAEPGIGYYFKDGSSTPTIYQDHPFNFTLSFGLRFNVK